MSDKKQNGTVTQEKRRYFRVDDVISVVANPVPTENENDRDVIHNVSSSKAFSLMETEGLPQGEAEDGAGVHPDNSKLYGMIAEIQTKLDFIINHFMLEKEGLLTAEKKLVNISATGVRFVIDHPAQVNDVMEIKLLLPTYPPVAVFAYGEVKRVKQLDDKKYEIALEYLNMGESVRNEIVQYTLAHQRETIRKTRESEAHEQS